MAHAAARRAPTRQWSSPRRPRPATTAGRVPPATRGGPLSPFVPGGFHHAVYGADVVLAALTLCAETLDAIRNHSWTRPAPSTPEGEVVAWADRIAYVCHDLEDAVAAGIVTPAMLPDAVRAACGDRRSRQLGALIAGVVDTTLAH